MIEKIISGGQEGAERAALDAAIRLGIFHGGWAPKGRLAEDGVIPGKYDLEEMPTASFPEKIKKNIRTSDGTLIFVHGSLTGDLAKVVKIAARYSTPLLHIDLKEIIAFNAATLINDWITDNRITVLHVTGSRGSKDPKIYQATLDILQAVYFLNLTEAGLGQSLQSAKLMDDAPTRMSPISLDDARDIIIDSMTLKDRTLMAHLEEENLAPLQLTLGLYIKQRLDIWTGNEAFRRSCHAATADENLGESNLPMVLIKEIWKKLRKTHRLRIVK